MVVVPFVLNKSAKTEACTTLCFTALVTGRWNKRKFLFLSSWRRFTYLLCIIYSWLTCVNHYVIIVDMVVRKQRRSHQIAIRFTPQEIRILKRGAKEEGLTVSEYLRLMTLLYYYSMGLDNRVEVLSRELPQRLMDIFYLKRYRS